jgi:hypothetical protein
MIVCKLSNQRLKMKTLKRTNRRFCKKENLCCYKKKILGDIDFKLINDIISGRHHSKNLELSPSDIMRFKYASINRCRLMWNDHLAVLKIYSDLIGGI